jgi:hypothetical protein
MQASAARRAVAASMSVVSSLGLPVDEAIVLQDSNRLTLRLQLLHGEPHPGNLLMTTNGPLFRAELDREGRRPASGRG